jgi:cobalt-zinc-cadmium efflux system protein
MAAHPGIIEVHDLHVWEVTSGFSALSAHVLVPPGEDCHARRFELEELLHDRFGIEHTTLQVEHEATGLLDIAPGTGRGAGAGRDPSAGRPSARR